jgi:hypothetical protein
VRWVAAREHSGENVGGTPSHAMFVGLKEARPGGTALGPAGP